MMLGTLALINLKNIEYHSCVVINEETGEEIAYKRGEDVNVVNGYSQNTLVGIIKYEEVAYIRVVKMYVKVLNNPSSNITRPSDIKMIERVKITENMFKEKQTYFEQSGVITTLEHKIMCELVDAHDDQIVSSLYEMAKMLGIEDLYLIDKDKFKTFLKWAIAKWKEEGGTL